MDSHAAHLAAVDGLLARPLDVTTIGHTVPLPGTAAGFRGVVGALSGRWGRCLNLVMGGYPDSRLMRLGWQGLVLALGGAARVVEMRGWVVRDRFVGCAVIVPERPGAPAPDTARPGAAAAGAGEELVAVVARRTEPALGMLPDDESRERWVAGTWPQRLALVTGWQPGRGRRAVDWAAVEDRLGTALPSDYKELLDVFGAGGFDGFVWLVAPGPGPGGLIGRTERRERSGDRPGGSGRYRARSLYHPYPEFPEPGGVLAWAHSEWADFCWLTEGGDPDAWPVVARGEAETEWERSGESASEFLHRVLTDPWHPFSIAGLLDAHTFEPLP